MTEEPKAALSIEELAEVGPRINPEDQAWLMFLFLADGVNREADTDRWNKYYWSFIWKKLLVVIVFYPVTFIWGFCRKWF